MPLLADPTNVGNEPGYGPLRAGGVSLTGLPTAEAHLPSTLSPEAKKQAPAVEMVRDLWGGTETVRARGEVYLPRSPGEQPKNYTTRLSRSVFTNFFRRTVEGLVGFIFRRDPVLGDDVPAQIAGTETEPGHWENIDNCGTHGDVFLRDVEADAMAVGHAAIFVDYPNTGDAKLTLADEQGLRPYWLPIRKDNILSWRTTVENGVMVLTQIVLHECEYVADGLYGEKMQDRYRVIKRERTEGGIVVRFDLFEITKDKKVVSVGTGVYRNQVEIPIAEVKTSGSHSMFCSTPPLLDLAYLNIAHYQQASDYAVSLHMTCVPLLFTAGVQMQDEEGQPITVGPNSAIAASDPNAKASYVSHDGAALGSCKSALDDLKTDMATLGLSMLAPDKRAAETAEAKRIDKGTSDSSLSVAARALQDAAERALGFHALYLGLEDGGSITINRDFESMVMTPDEMNAWAAWIATGFPKREVVRAAKARGLLSPEADEEEIVDLWEESEDAKAELKDMENNSRAAALFGMGQGTPMPKKMPMETGEAAA